MDIFCRSVILSFAVYYLYLIDFSFQLNKKLVLLSLERPKITEVNKEFVQNVNMTSLRKERTNPIHYVEVWAEFIKTIDAYASFRLEIYEFLSNEYKPSFVDVNMNICDFYRFMPAEIFYTQNKSLPMKPYQLWFSNTCALRKGFYHFVNMAVPLSHIPKNFPFDKGRAMVTFARLNTTIAKAYMDLEFKTLPLRKRKN